MLMPPTPAYHRPPESAFHLPWPLKHNVDKSSVHEKNTCSDRNRMAYHCPIPVPSGEFLAGGNARQKEAAS